MELYQTILNQITQYITSLDWSFIITFILLAYLVNQPQVITFLYSKLRLKLKTRYRTLLVGFGYGLILFLVRNKDPYQAELLFRSILFAMIFHKLLIDQVISFFSVNFKSLSSNTTHMEDDFNKEL